LFFSFIVVLGRDTLGIYTDCNNVSNISYMNSPQYSPLSPSSRIPGVVSTDMIFTLAYMYTHFIAQYSPSYPLSQIPPASPCCQPFPLGPACSSLLFYDFVGEKKRKDKMET
jgi:hypothetical protein